MDFLQKQETNEGECKKHHTQRRMFVIAEKCGPVWLLSASPPHWQARTPHAVEHLHRLDSKSQAIHSHGQINSSIRAQISMCVCVYTKSVVQEYDTRSLECVRLRQSSTERSLGMSCIADLMRLVAVLSSCASAIFVCVSHCCENWTGIFFSWTEIFRQNCQPRT